MKTYKVIKDIGKYRVGTIINTNDESFEINASKLEEGSVVVFKRVISYSDTEYLEEVK